MKTYRNGPIVVLVIAVMLLVADGVLADTSYDEAIGGDLSGDRINPTALTLEAGSNHVTATSVAGDVEYLTVTVPDGMKLKAMMLVDFQSTDDLSFVAVQRGATFTEPTTGTNVANLLGYTHFGTGLNQIGTDILDDIGGGSGAIGFTQYLSSGDYTFWLQETGPVAVTYTFNLLVSPLNTNPTYAESTFGDMSDDRLNPLDIALGEGGNYISGTTVAGDVDYFTLHVDAQYKLEAILLQGFNSTDDLSFVAIQEGDVFTEPATGTDVGNLLGYTHFGTGLNQVGSDLLDDMGTAAGAIGFTSPLPANAYTLWVQETGPDEVEYTFEVVLTLIAPNRAHHESVDGDLSDDRLAPTAVSLAAGSNGLIGTTVAGDIDYVTFKLPPGHQLDAMVLESFISEDDVSFIAIQEGNIFTESATAPEVGNLLGWSHFGEGAGQLGRDILGDMGMGDGAAGFAPPLSGRDYTLWIQETGPNSATYGLNLQISKKPSVIYLPIIANN